MTSQGNRHPGSRLINHVMRRGGTAILFSGETAPSSATFEAVPLAAQPAFKGPDQPAPAPPSRIVPRVARQPAGHQPTAAPQIARSQPSPGSWPGKSPSHHAITTNNQPQTNFTAPIISRLRGVAQPVPTPAEPSEPVEIQRSAQPAGMPMTNRLPTPGQPRPAVQGAPAPVLAQSAASPGPADRRLGAMPSPAKILPNQAVQLQRETAPKNTGLAHAPTGKTEGQVSAATSRPSGPVLRQPASPEAASPAQNAASSPTPAAMPAPTTDSSSAVTSPAISRGQATGISRQAAASGAVSPPASQVQPAKADDRAAQLAIFRAESKGGVQKNWQGLSADSQWEVLQRVKAIGDVYAQRREAEQAATAAQQPAETAPSERPTRLMRRSKIIEVGTSSGQPLQTSPVAPFTEAEPTQPPTDALTQRQETTNLAGEAAVAADIAAKRPPGPNQLPEAQRSPDAKQPAMQRYQQNPTMAPQADSAAAVKPETPPAAETDVASGPSELSTAAPSQRQTAPSPPTSAQRLPDTDLPMTDLASMSIAAPPGEPTSVPTSPDSNSSLSKPEGPGAASLNRSLQGQDDDKRSLPASPAPELAAQRRPLEEAWPVERRGEMSAGSSSPAGSNPPAVDGRSLLRHVPPGQPTAAAIEFVPPTRPRPAAQPDLARPAGSSAVQRTPEPARGASEPAAAPPPSSAGADPIPTEFGPLPADLWRQIGVEPPRAAPSNPAAPRTEKTATTQPANGQPVTGGAVAARTASSTAPMEPGQQTEFPAADLNRPVPLAVQRVPEIMASESGPLATSTPAEPGADLTAMTDVDDIEMGRDTSGLLGPAGLTDSINVESEMPAVLDQDAGQMQKDAAAPTQTADPEQITMSLDEERVKDPIPVLVERDEGQEPIMLYADRQELDDLPPSPEGSAAEDGLQLFVDESDADDSVEAPTPVSLSNSERDISLSLFADASRLEDLADGLESDDEVAMTTVFADEELAADHFDNPAEIICQIPGEPERFLLFSDGDILDELRDAAETLDDEGVLQAYASEREANEYTDQIARILLKDDDGQEIFYGFADQEALEKFLSGAEQHDPESLVNSLARQVYHGLQGRLAIERERRGRGHLS